MLGTPELQLLSNTQQAGTLGGTGNMAQFSSPTQQQQGRQQSVYLLDALKGGVAVAEGAQGVGHAVWARQGTQQQLEVIERAGQSLV